MTFSSKFSLPLLTDFALISETNYILKKMFSYFLLVKLDLYIFHMAQSANLLKRSIMKWWTSSYLAGYFYRQTPEEITAEDLAVAVPGECFFPELCAENEEASHEEEKGILVYTDSNEGKVSVGVVSCVRT